MVIIFKIVDVCVVDVSDSNDFMAYGYFYKKSHPSKMKICLQS